jgi:hypothetical protein
MNRSYSNDVTCAGRMLAAATGLVAAGASALGQCVESWRPQDPGTALNGPVFAWCEFDGGLVAGGHFTADGTGQTLSRVARWDGSAWSPLGTGLPVGVSALVAHEGRLVAARTSAAPSLSLWDGASWAPLPSQTVGGGVLALAVYNGELVAGGSFTSIDGVAASRIAAWDGSQWRPLATSMAGGAGGLLICSHLRSSMESLLREASIM